jgi:hypothetical protein
MSLAEGAGSWSPPPALVRIGLPGSPETPQWAAITWLDVVEALDDDPDPLTRQFVDFVLADILGLGPVDLEHALAGNGLYALGGAALRKRFGDRTRYENSASRPLHGKYRYLGTTFSLDGGAMEYWLGLVNEGVPLSDHYHLMLASKDRPVLSPVEPPRVTGDWKWKHWTGVGRVVRPITPETLADLLDRLPA